MTTALQEAYEIHDVNFLNENHIIALLIEDLQKNNYQITHYATTRQTGYDIVAQQLDIKLIIEAKGATSSKSESNRSGQSFSTNQVKNHIATAILKAMETMTEQENCLIGLAFPNNQVHRQRLEKSRCALQKLGLIVYLVSTDGVELF